MTKVIIDSIKYTLFVQNDNGEDFANRVRESVELIQSKGLFVEIDYKQVVVPGGIIVYSALLLGKEKIYVEVM